MNASVSRPSLLWVAFAAYVAAEILGAYRHEPWFDELLHWNLARTSATPLDLLGHLRYHGHPPVWHLMLWVASRLTQSVGALHAVQLVAATGVAALVLFAAPFRPLLRVLILAGYYFLFEYGVLCRNYAIGVLLLFSLCIVQRRGLTARPIPYYALLFALANVHFLFLLLAGSLQLSVLWEEGRRGTMDRLQILRHAALGAVLLFIPLLFIVLPPRDGQLTPSFWVGLWAPQNLFWVLVAPLRALIPLPAWWRYHFWNTQALLEVGNEHLWAKVVAGCASVALVAVVFLAVPRRGKARLFLAVGFFLCLAAALIFPLTSARYAGVLFIALLAALWMAGPHHSKLSNAVLTSLLVVHAAAGIFAFQRDLRLPFSGSTKVVALAEAIPRGGTMVADYTTLESISAYLNHPVYSLQQGKTVWFAHFDRSLDPHRSYADGLERFFAASGVHEAFLFSPWSPDDARAFDASFAARFEAVLLGKYDGAIAPGSDIHLYRVTRRD